MLGTNSVDMCFIMDCTGSMSSHMTRCKEDISRAVTSILERFPTHKIHLGFVAYRDWCDEPRGLRIQTFDFSRDVEGFQGFVGGLAATGGGDYPEDVLGGLWTAANLDWTSRTRALIHIFDAPPHGRPLYHDHSSDSLPDGHASDKPPEEIFEKFRDKNILYFMYKLNNGLQKVVDVFTERGLSIGYAHVMERADVDVSDIIMDAAMAVIESIGVRLARRGAPEVAAEITRPVLARRHYEVYAAIDFGTHGSAYAFCTPTNPQPTSDQCWSGTAAGIKTLTNLCLTKDRRLVDGSNAFGHAALQYFLDQDPEEQEELLFFRRFKMALYESEIATDDRKEEIHIERRIRPVNNPRVRVSSVTVLSRALKFMFDHVLEQANERFGAVDPANVQWIVTVPAIWSGQSRQMMRQAAEEAMEITEDQLLIVLEPECASIMARDTLRVEPGECYMLVDCGGGTVDIACHELVNTTDVDEIYPASGGPWGGTYIDDHFFEYLRVAFGDEVMDELEREMARDGAVREELIKYFNEAKCTVDPGRKKTKITMSPLLNVLHKIYEGDFEDRVNEKLAGAVYEGVRGCGRFRKGTLAIPMEIWQALFGTVINPMIEHMHKIFRTCTRAHEMRNIVLVGGFAQSALLFAKLKEAFPDRRVVRPPEPMLAVVRGAAKFGLIPTIIRARRAAMTYGIAIQDSWKESDGVDRRLPAEDGGFVSDGVFFPFVRRGQELPRDMPPVAYYFEPIDPHQFAIEVYESTDENPRFVPPRPRARIGPIDLPDEFDRMTTIRVEFDFSGRELTVAVKLGEMAERKVKVDYEVRDGDETDEEV